MPRGLAVLRQGHTDAISRCVAFGSRRDLVATALTDKYYHYFIINIIIIIILISLILISQRGKTMDR